MKLRDFPLLTDQNIHGDVVAFLRGTGFDVLDVNESGWAGETDLVLFHRAAAMGRVVVTHDADFGQLAVQNLRAFTGILFLRPGHLLPALTVGGLEQLLTEDPDLQSPFLIVVTTRLSGTRIRTANLTS